MGVGDKWESTQRQDEGRKDIKGKQISASDNGNLHKADQSSY